MPTTMLGAMMIALRVGGDFDPVLDRHRDLDRLRLRLNGFDAADRDTDDADLVARIQPDRRREISDHLLAATARPDQVDATDQAPAPGRR